MPAAERSFEYKGYHVKVHVDRAQDGGYWTWATFHREGDEQERTPRHRMPGTFKESGEAMDSMESFARQLVDDGKIGD